jgi:nickel transport protein
MTNTIRTFRAMLIALALSFAASGAQAHGLNVFAFVENGEVVVEARYSSGRVPTEGTVRVYDGADMLVGTMALSEDGTLRFPLTDAAQQSGLRIEVDTGSGHEDYWLLTPADIAAGLEAAG